MSHKIFIVVFLIKFYMLLLYFIFYFLLYAVDGKDNAGRTETLSGEGQHECNSESCC